MNVIERLESLAEEWRDAAAAAVNGAEPADYADLWDELDNATRDALPDLLAAVNLLAEEECAESGTTRERCWDQDQDDWPREDWCRRCIALEPLFREVEP